MRALPLAILLMTAAPVTGCREAPTGAVRWMPRFGPVLRNDAIVGRAYTDGRVLLLTDRPALVAVDLKRQKASEHAVSGRGIDVLWGLARLDDDSLWTLAGQRALGKIEADGRISERIPLSAAHVGVFGAGPQLVYQILSFVPPVDALAAGPPGEQSRRPWSSMQTRSYRLARASVAALNLVSCGATETAEIPCWFPDETAVTLVHSTGQSSRRVVLTGLPVVRPEVLLTSENPARPIRDVFVAESRELWVLGSGTPRQDDRIVVPGGWLLARYDSQGRPIRSADLPEGARLILRAAGSACLLLASDGRVVEVPL